MSQAGPSNHKPRHLIFHLQLQALPHVDEEWQGQSKGAGVLGRGCPSSPRREHRGHGQVSVALMKPGLGVHLLLWPVIWAVCHGHSNHLWHQPVILHMSAVSQKKQEMWVTGRQSFLLHVTGSAWKCLPCAGMAIQSVYWFWDSVSRSWVGREILDVGSLGADVWH